MVAESSSPRMDAFHEAQRPTSIRAASGKARGAAHRSASVRRSQAPSRQRRRPQPWPPPSPSSGARDPPSHRGAAVFFCSSVTPCRPSGGALKDFLGSRQLALALLSFAAWFRYLFGRLFYNSSTQTIIKKRFLDVLHARLY